MPESERIFGLKNVDHLKFLFTQYIREIRYLKLYVIPVALGIILSYSVYIFFSAETVSNLGQEDHFFENLTVICFIAAFILSFLTYLKTKNLFFLLLAIVFFIGAGEEISWGQRIFGFATPEALNKVNVQGETTIHNIGVFQGIDYQGKSLNRWSRLLEINFLFRLFTMFFGIILPLCVYHIKFLSTITMKIKLPVPPISIGIFFFLNWLTYRTLHTYFLPQDNHLGYVTAAGEIFECLGAFILFIISLYFYNKNKMIIIGKDIKQII